MKQHVKYGTSYFGNRMRKYVSQDMQEIVDNGFEYVIHTYSENDMMYYESTMREIIGDCHKKGLEVMLSPWGFGGVFGGEAFSKLINMHPDMNQVQSTGEMVPVACFNNPLFREKMQDWIFSAAEIGADVILWDEPHWYIPSWYNKQSNGDELWVCHCIYCKEKYKNQYSEDLPQTQNQRTQNYFEESIIDFLDFASTFANNKGVKNSVCLIPGEAYNSGVSNWEKVIALPNIDMFGTDPYWVAHKRPMEEYVTRYANKVLELCTQYNKEPQYWIQAFSIPTGQEDDVEKASLLAIGLGHDNIAFWGFKACEHMSKLRPDNPQAVWQNVLKVVNNSNR